VTRQERLFSDAPADFLSLLPKGFRYESKFIDSQMEDWLVQALQGLELKPFDFYGYLGNQRVVSS